MLQGEESDIAKSFQLLLPEKPDFSNPFFYFSMLLELFLISGSFCLTKKINYFNFINKMLNTDVL